MTRTAAFRTPSGIAYWVLGKGPPVLTVHGGPGTDHGFFRPYLDPLAEDRQIVYFDLPGHGQSAPPDDFALDAMAMAIDDVRMTLGVDRFSLIGSSYGGFLSLLYAIRRPDLVTSLILVDTSASYDFRHESLQTAKRQGRAETLDALHRLWDGSLESDRAFQADWQEILPLYFHQLTRQKIQRIADNISYRLETRKQILPTLQGYNVRDQLGSINLPCLVIVGRHDWITSAAQAEELASGLPNGELIVFEESGHYPFIEENDAFLHRVRDWLLMHGA